MLLIIMIKMSIMMKMLVIALIGFLSVLSHAATYVIKALLKSVLDVNQLLIAMY